MAVTEGLPRSGLSVSLWFQYCIAGSVNIEPLPGGHTAHQVKAHRSPRTGPIAAPFLFSGDPAMTEPTSPIRVLIADDHLLFRDGLAVLLQR